MTNENPVAHPLSLSELIDIRYLRLGLPMWFMPQWPGRWLPDGCRSQEALSCYSRAWSSVEGNTTFYGLPDSGRCQQWRDRVPQTFRFCFKIPRSISHADNLWLAATGTAELPLFLQAMEGAIGVLMIQLPASFAPDRLCELEQLLGYLQTLTSAALAVEVRHPAFFDKGPAEKALLRMLADNGADRVLFDSRGLYADTSGQEAVLEAQTKKPRLPLHPVATGQNPVVRFIGHSDYAMNAAYLAQWQKKIQEWGQQGKTCWFFIHTASNADAPAFAEWVARQWHLPAPVWPAPDGGSVTGDLFAADGP